MNRGDMARRLDRRLRRDPSRTAALIVIALVAISAAVLGLDRVTSRRPSTVSNSPSPAPNATMESTPTPVPLSVAPCSPDDLALEAGGWSGATGSMAGGAGLINMSIDPCSIAGWPKVDLLANDTVIAMGTPASPGPAVALLPGDFAGVITVWSNWCGDAHPGDLVLRLSLLDWDRELVAPVVLWRQPGVIGGPAQDSVPRCDEPNAPSAIGVPQPWATPQAPDGGYVPESCTTVGLTAYLGSCGVAAGTSYANVVVFNQSGFDCLLATSPPLELRDTNGRLLTSAERWANPESTFLLPAGWAAISTIGFADWCVAPPRLPFRFDLRIGDRQLTIAPTSARSEIGIPNCNSAPATPPPSLGYTGPFALPGQ